RAPAGQAPRLWRRPRSRGRRARGVPYLPEGLCVARGIPGAGLTWSWDTSFSDGSFGSAGGLVPCRLLPVHSEIVEVRLGVRLGPQADLAHLVDAVVLDVEVLLPIEEALDVVANVLDLQSVPFAGVKVHVGALELLAALAGDDLVDAEVVLQRVHAGDVVVVGVLVAPHQAAALVLLALHRLERHRRLDVLEAGFVRDTEVEESSSVVRGLGQDEARPGWGRIVGHDLPDARAPARLGGLPAGRDLTDIVLAELDSSLLVVGGPDRPAQQRDHRRHLHPSHGSSSPKKKGSGKPVTTSRPPLPPGSIVEQMPLEVNLRLD